MQVVPVLEIPTGLLRVVMEGAAGGLRLILECLSLLCVAIGLGVTLIRPLCQGRLSLRRVTRPSNSARLTFGSWLSMALEFQLGSDIVATTASPSEQNLIQLGVVAVIRTFLNVFLAREVEAERTLEDQENHRPSVITNEQRP